jgi:TfoX/Sxy family transcriptional regulator of competence genes
MPSPDGVKSPKSTPLTRDAFRRLVPDDERVTVRPMFGSVAAFVSGQMFMCLFADEMYFKLKDDDREALARIGGAPLEPMPGRPMKGYASLPDWQARPDDVREWGLKSLDYVATLPPKK